MPSRARRSPPCSATRRARREYLIENLHRVQDRFGRLSAAHLAALGRGDEALAGRGLRGRDLLPPLRRGEGGRRARRRSSRCACATRSRARWRARRSSSMRLKATLGPNVRVVAAPCIGRCAEAPAVCVGQNAFGHATAEKVAAVAKEGLAKAPAHLAHRLCAITARRAATRSGPIAWPASATSNRS